VPCLRSLALPPLALNARETGAIGTPRFSSIVSRSAGRCPRAGRFLKNISKIRAPRSDSFYERTNPGQRCPEGVPLVLERR